MPRRLPADMPTVAIDPITVAWWLGACVVGSSMWVAVGLGVCSLAGWC